MSLINLFSLTFFSINSLLLHFDINVCIINHFLCLAAFNARFVLYLNVWSCLFIVFYECFSSIFFTKVQFCFFLCRYPEQPFRFSWWRNRLNCTQRISRLYPKSILTLWPSAFKILLLVINLTSTSLSVLSTSTFCPMYQSVSYTAETKSFVFAFVSVDDCCCVDFSTVLALTFSPSVSVLLVYANKCVSQESQYLPWRQMAQYHDVVPNFIIRESLVIAFAFILSGSLIHHAFDGASEAVSWTFAMSGLKVIPPGSDIICRLVVGNSVKYESIPILTRGGICPVVDLRSGLTSLKVELFCP